MVVGIVFFEKVVNFWVIIVWMILGLVFFCSLWFVMVIVLWVLLFFICGFWSVFVVYLYEYFGCVGSFVVRLFDVFFLLLVKVFVL